MSDDFVLWDVEDGVATITFNRPERHNAQNPAFETRYIELLRRADNDPEVRVVIVTGAGKAFCVGGDLDTLDDIAEGGGWDEQLPGVLRRFSVSIRKPVVAAINGSCAGSGLVYAVTSDIRFASAGAKFTTGFVRMGLAAERAISWYLPRIVGMSHALDLLLSGRVVLAEEALEMGLVNKVVPPEQLMETALAWARETAERSSPTAMAIIKSQIYRDSSLELMQSVAESAEITFRLLSGADLREGVDAFRARRPPKFAPLGPPSLAAQTPANPL